MENNFLEYLVLSAIKESTWKTQVATFRGVLSPDVCNKLQIFVVIADNTNKNMDEIVE